MTGRKEVAEIEEGNRDARDQEVEIAIIVIVAAMTGKEDGGGLVPVHGPGPRARGVGAGTAKLAWKSLPSRWFQR